MTIFFSPNYIFSPLSIIVGSFSEFFVFITICMSTLRNCTAGVQLVLSSPHRLHKTGEHPSWSPLHSATTATSATSAPAPLPRSALLQDEEHQCRHLQPPEPGRWRTIYISTYLYIYISTHVPGSPSPHPCTPQSISHTL